MMGGKLRATSGRVEGCFRKEEKTPFEYSLCSTGRGVQYCTYARLMWSGSPLFRCVNVCCCCVSVYDMVLPNTSVLAS